MTGGGTVGGVKDEGFVGVFLLKGDQKVEFLDPKVSVLLCGGLEFDGLCLSHERKAAVFLAFPF